jgi:hypothetical protein
MFHIEEYIMADSSSSSESNPVVMEEENTWKISVLEEEDTWKIPVVSNDIGPDNKWMDTKHNRQLQEHYALKQAINIFPMPHHSSYNSLIVRTRSFENANWPETNLSPMSLAEAGFFYDRKLITF